MIGVRMFLWIIVLSSQVKKSGGEALNAQAVDRCVRVSIGNEFRHDRTGSWSQLEPVQRESELVEKSLMLGTRAEDGKVVRRPRLDPGPGPDDCRIAHDREKLPHGAGALLELAPVQNCLAS